MRKIKEPTEKEIKDLRENKNIELEFKKKVLARYLNKKLQFFQKLKEY